MSWLLSYIPFVPKPRPLPTVVPTDEVVPVQLFDNTSTLRKVIMVWSFRFEEVLDPDKLNDSLSQLLQMEGWRKLGGRFRRRLDGGVEIHIPSPFTDDRPPVYFTKEQFVTPMCDHPLASQLPQATENISTSPGPRYFNPLHLGPGSARSWDDYIYGGDLPQLALHVLTFTDGTIVTLSHSHATADLIGFETIIDAWSLVLNGRPESVPHFMPLHEDGMAGLLEPATEKHVLSGKELNGWRLAYWGLSTLYNSRRIGLESRLVCIPKRRMDRIMEECRAQIGSKIDPETKVMEPFISEGDVFVALVNKVTAQMQNPASTRNLMTMMALDPRNRAPSMFRPNTAVVQNSPTAIFFNCPSDQALKLSVGELASLSRQAILAQATEEQMKAYSAMSAETVRSNDMNVMFGDKDMSFQLISNWFKGKLLDKLDCTAAIVKEAPNRTQGRRGHPVYFHGTDPDSIDDALLIPLIVIMNTDYDGNRWLSCVLPKKAWGGFLKTLESFATAKS
ncbi:hypothetical protein F5Y18DRAFT_336789 [Xylariaceae sp. FL1019]|nr:hypothetical protein F5Y18DRAFT_336789 [Xylariaceae sp. FL1019]